MESTRIQKCSTFLFSTSFVENITRYLLSAFFMLSRSHKYFAFRINIKRGFVKGTIAFKKISCVARSLYGEQYQTFIAHSILHLVFCVTNLARYGHFLVSVMKISMGIYEIYLCHYIILQVLVWKWHFVTG